MRVKHSVNFRMAPKESSKGKGVAAEPTREEGWVLSKCSGSDLENLVSDRLLPAKSVIQWGPALGEDRPYENTGEIVAFAPYFEQEVCMQVRVVLKLKRSTQVVISSSLLCSSTFVFLECNPRWGKS